MGPFLLAPLSCALAAMSLILPYHPPGALAAHLSPQPQQLPLSWNGPEESEASLGRDSPGDETQSGLSNTLDSLLDAMAVMQDKYFDVATATWPTSIDWTAAVLATHISATLSTIVSSVDCFSRSGSTTCSQALTWSDLVNRYFAHTSIFYFGESALSLRQQAYDDMLWVVLDWLEDVKLIDLFNSVSSQTWQAENTTILGRQQWHGTQFKAPAAHRARTFYELASQGWDSSLCGGGMVWSPYLWPYKNSITNELFIAASVSMYLYFPGDDNESPFVSTTSHSRPAGSNPHDRRHLDNAIRAYDWLHKSNMTSPDQPGLYADGFHIRGWQRDAAGHVDPGTGQCDVLNTMVYTYNQGVVLTGLRGLWLALGSKRYLDDGHDLVSSVIKATGWPDIGGTGWAGLGRAGVLEDYCDSRGTCSQNGHTFKGIFFHHLAEFCRVLSPFEQDFLGSRSRPHRRSWTDHLIRCDAYRAWLTHNAHAAAVTRDEEGRFGTWWGRVSQSESKQSPSSSASSIKPPPLPSKATDHQNQGVAHSLSDSHPPSPPSSHLSFGPASEEGKTEDPNDRGRGRTVETQSGGLAVLRALWQWESVAAAAAAAAAADGEKGG